MSNRKNSRNKQETKKSESKNECDLMSPNDVKVVVTEVIGEGLAWGALNVMGKALNKGVKGVIDSLTD